MKNIKFYSLICFFILFVFSPNISAQEELENHVFVEANKAQKFQAAIKKVKKSVVLLSMNQNANPETDPSKSGLCSGVVINEIGHVLTNYHCVHNQNYLRLFYYDENDWQTYEVKTIGKDPLADLALLEVTDKEEPIPFLKFADDIANLEEGTEVFALGHPMGMAWTVTKGIISSTERYARHPFIKALQTDAAINKGNSGGPLLNMRGEIVGINALIVSRISENAGVGLAIRGDIVENSVKSMIANGGVDRPAIGIMIMPLNSTKQRDVILKEFPKLKSKFVPNTFGIFVRPSDTLPNGVKKYGTIIAINDIMINNSLQFSDEIYKYGIGDMITLTVVRKRRFLKVDVPLKVFPVNVDALYPTQSGPALVPKQIPKKP